MNNQIKHFAAFLCAAVALVFLCMFTANVKADDDAVDLGSGYVMIQNGEATLYGYSGDETLESLGISYDSDTMTLTLDNVNVITTGTFIQCIDGTSKDTLTIKLVGDNSVESRCFATNFRSAIYTTGGSLKFDGNYLISCGYATTVEDLIITGAVKYLFSVSNDVTMTNVTLDVTSQDTSTLIQAGQKLTIEDSNIKASTLGGLACGTYGLTIENTTIEATYGDYCFTSGYDIVIVDSNITVTGQASTFSTGDNVEISGSTFTATTTGSNCYGINVGDDITITDSEVTLNDYVTGLEAANIYLDKSKLNLNVTKYGICSTRNPLTINDGKIVINATGDNAIGIDTAYNAFTINGGTIIINTSNKAVFNTTESNITISDRVSVKAGDSSDSLTTAEVADLLTNKCCAIQCLHVDEAGEDATSKVGTVDATTDKEGYTGDLVCSICLDVLEKGTAIDKLPSDDDDDDDDDENSDSKKNSDDDSKPDDDSNPDDTDDQVSGKDVGAGTSKGIACILTVIFGAGCIAVCVRRKEEF